MGVVCIRKRAEYTIALFSKGVPIIGLSDISATDMVILYKSVLGTKVS